jgi:hypothetical protein
MMEHYQIDVGYACFGVLLRDNVVVDVAPIGKWMIGKSFVQVEKWVASKNGKIIKVNNEKER